MKTYLGEFHAGFKSSQSLFGKQINLLVLHIAQTSLLCVNEHEHASGLQLASTRYFLLFSNLSIDEV